MGTTISGATGIDKVQDSSITSAKIANGAITNDDINSSAAIAGSKISGSFGKVLQVVSMNTTDVVTASSVNWHSTAVTASITPSSTSSKILVSCECQMYTQNTVSDGGMAIRIEQAISGGATTYPDAIHSKSAANYSAYYTSEPTGQFAFRAPLSGLVSPNTTSAITYTLHFIPYTGTNSAGINSMNGRSTLTLMEIAG